MLYQVVFLIWPPRVNKQVHHSAQEVAFYSREHVTCVLKIITGSKRGVCVTVRVAYLFLKRTAFTLRMSFNKSIFKTSESADGI